MTVAELREALEGFPDDMGVVLITKDGSDTEQVCDVYQGTNRAMTCDEPVVVIAN